MSEDSNATSDSDANSTTDNPFSSQATGLVETTFAETLGLSMHNAIVNQQSAQMTASASITNACARLLQSPTPILPTKDAADGEGDGAGEEASSDSGSSDGESDESNSKPDKPKKWLRIKNFMKKQPKEGEADIPETPYPVDQPAPDTPPTTDQGNAS